MKVTLKNVKEIINFEFPYDFSTFYAIISKLKFVKLIRAEKRKGLV